MTVANDVVYYPSMDLDGTVFFLKADTGKLLGSFKTGQTTGCGPSVVKGRVYIGSGYSNFGLGLANNKLYMLSP
jgi:polyvinyl alcohol dehydrogenase (cytochrome)